jgi:hypothetical protein
MLHAYVFRSHDETTFIRGIHRDFRAVVPGVIACYRHIRGVFSVKKIFIVVLVVFSLLFAGFAEAAKAKKRTRNANRVGPYAGATVNYANYTAAQDDIEADLLIRLANQGAPSQNLTASSKTNGTGYQANFGFRFTRYFAAELALAQYGDLSSTARGELDAGDGFLPSSMKLSFRVSGPLFSAIGILPINEKFELYGRAAVLFASSERAILFKYDGQTAGAGSGRGDSTELVYGVGFSYNINSVYSITGEYQKLTDVGEVGRTGTESLDVLGLGFKIRF